MSPLPCNVLQKLIDNHSLSWPGFFFFLLEANSLVSTPTGYRIERQYMLMVLVMGWMVTVLFTPRREALLHAPYTTTYSETGQRRSALSSDRDSASTGRSSKSAPMGCSAAVSVDMALVDAVRAFTCA